MTTTYDRNSVNGVSMANVTDWDGTPLGDADVDLTVQLVSASDGTELLPETAMAWRTASEWRYFPDAGRYPGNLAIRVVVRAYAKGTQTLLHTFRETFYDLEPA